MNPRTNADGGGPALAEMPWLCNVVADQDRRYRLRADIAGDAPHVELPDGQMFRPSTLSAEWAWTFSVDDGDGWHLLIAVVEGLSRSGDDLLCRPWGPQEKLPGWLARLLDREHPAAVVGS